MWWRTKNVKYEVCEDPTKKIGSIFFNQANALYPVPLPELNLNRVSMKLTFFNNSVVITGSEKILPQQ